MAAVDREELLARVDLRALLDELSPVPPGSHAPSARWACVERDHPDGHPSVSVTVDAKGIERWKCWSGDHGGTAIDAMMAATGSSIAVAIDELARRVGLIGPAALTPVRPKVVPAPPPSELGLAPDALRYLHSTQRVMWGPAGTKVLAWARARGWADDVLRANGVGADPGPDVLWRAKGLPWHGPGVVLPARSVTGDAMYLQTRYLQVPEGRSKYDNPPAAMARNPKLGWVTCPEPRRRDVLLVTEGIADGLTAATMGFNAVSILGATYPNEQLARQLVAGAAGRSIWLAFDGDSAGKAATAKLTELLAAEHVVAVDVGLPDGTDLNGMHLADPGWLRSRASELAGSWPPPAALTALQQWTNQALYAGEITPTKIAADACHDQVNAMVDTLGRPERLRQAAEGLAVTGTRSVLLAHGYDFGPNATVRTLTGVWAANGEPAMGAAVRDLSDPMWWRQRSDTGEQQVAYRTAMDLAGKVRSLTGQPPAVGREPHVQRRGRVVDPPANALRLVR